MVSMVERLAHAEVSDAEGVRTWLAEIERTRDLTLPLPRLEAAAAAHGTLAQRFVDGLREEMANFREIVEGASEAAALNARQLDAIAGTTADHSAVVEQTAAAIAEIDRGAAHVADTAEALRAQAGTMAESTSRYDAGIDQVLSRLDAVAAAVEAAAAFAGAMDSGSGQISAFLDRLRRIARQAGLLSINAAIEAAHLGERGRGFDIVASEVKKLAASTDESAANVKTIERELHDASAQVEKTINESASIVRGLARDLHAARERSGATREQVRELDRAIGDVATIAAEQSASLSSVAGGVESIARHAHEISTAAERAARLALGDALAGLQASIGTYRLGEGGAHGAHGAGAPVEVESLPPAVREAAGALRARVDADQRELLRGITAIAVSIARNSYEWRAIADGLVSLRTQLEATTHAVDENAAGAEVAGGAAQRMRESLDAMRAGFGSSVEELQRALERVVRVRETVQHAESYVSATTAAGDRAAKILDLIDAISSETTLLSLNAAIEAAHAGDAGAGFGVIADEIRRLAEGTSQATSEIAGVIAGVAEASGSMSRTTAAAVAQTAGVFDETTRMQGTVGELRNELNGTLQQASEVAGVVEQQLAALAQVRTATQMALRRVESDTVAATDSRRLELALLGMRAHGLAARRPLGIVAESIRSLGHSVAEQMDAVFDAVIARRELRLDDFFDTSYVELKGPLIARLGRLFDVSRVPESGFNPPKFETRYDRFVEDGIDAIIDASVSRHPAIKAMFAVDLNGFCFGHYRDCRRDWTGVRTTDLDHNRIKRFFEDDLSLRCSRVGLGAGADDLARRTAYATFRERSCALTLDGERPWAIYTYARDTGIVYNDLSVALYAQRRRIGTIRIIYDADVV